MQSAVEFAILEFSKRADIPKEEARKRVEEALESAKTPKERFITLTTFEKFGESVYSLENLKGDKESEKALYTDTTQKPCGKCGKRLAHVGTKQTRSGDESQTVFVTCICGHWWKF